MNKGMQESVAGAWRKGWVIPAMITAVLLQGCFSSAADDTATGRSGSGAGDGGETINADASAVNSSSESYRIGMIRDGVFTEGKIDVGIEELSAGGSVGLSVAIVDATGTPVSKAFNVTFNSVCNTNGLAEISPAVSTNNGVATATYQAKGCSGEDVITARARVDAGTGSSSGSGTDKELQALGSVKVKPADLGAVEFVSATPTTIALKGMGGAGLSHTSTVRFRVLNAVGGPVANQPVKFSLNTAVGGIELQPAEGRTDSQGFVQTVVEAGDVHTSVRVTAETQSATGEIIKTQSSQLVISTGIPDQDSVSLSLSVHNPEAWGYDGEQVDVNVYASDRYNNPVPDGTSVSFYTELGQIEPSCLTQNGFCSVKWTSSNPRQDQGRSTITAVMIGEDTFVDLDGDGLYDDSDDLTTDEGEVWEDWNENGQYDASSERFLDFNRNGQLDADGDGKFTGLGCQSGCSVDAEGNNIELKHVFDRAVLVMAESGLNIVVSRSSISLDKTNGPSSASFTVTISGAINGQTPPFETSVSVSTDVGKLYGPTDYKVPSNNGGPITLSFVVDAGDLTEAKSGRIEITATTPKGVKNGTSIGITAVP